MMRPMAAAAFVTILVVATSTGCASNSPKPPAHWVPLGDSDDVGLKRAMYECERDTRRAFERNTRGVIFRVWKSADEQAFYAGCMEAHGFTRAAD